MPCILEYKLVTRPAPNHHLSPTRLSGFEQTKFTNNAFSAFHLKRAFCLILLGAFGLAACDHGLGPPEEPGVGAIRAVIRYRGVWPPPDSLFDLRLVALRFVPKDTADLLQLTGLEFSPQRLPLYVESDTAFIPDVRAGIFLYTGVAQRYTSSPLSWRPVGLYTGNEGIFAVRSGDTTDISIDVDFQSLPLFPPR